MKNNPILFPKDPVKELFPKPIRTIRSFPEEVNKPFPAGDSEYVKKLMEEFRKKNEERIK